MNSEEDLVLAEQFIAHVLGEAHRTAMSQDAPNEARSILELAHSFADEMSEGDPQFDRLRFIQAATEDQS